VNVTSDMTNQDYNASSSAPGTLDYFEVDVPDLATAGVVFSATITAKDSGGDTVTDVVGPTTLSVDSGDISPICIADTKFVDGVWLGSATLSDI